MDDFKGNTPQLRLEPVTTAVVELGQPQELGEVLTGRRRIIPIIGGRFDGPLLQATILNGGADWQLVAADGTAIIDTRYSARSDDGHLFYISTSGFRSGPPAVLARLAAGELVSPSEYSFRIAARIETQSPAHLWMNATFFVAAAQRLSSSVTYELFALR
jgi:Protein of unknown function (DUF3237)